PEGSGYRLVECPHRLSDKLLKSSELAAAACYLEVAYITLFTRRVKRLFRFSLSDWATWFSLEESLFPVSGGAL
ncbi:hypothetical protein, partial [Serratia quinivorans]|uniref:hypothetical protein n=1 Tax=Serratia quinivorans TaxID=137545 RepID=UPI0021BD6AE8